MIKNLILLTGPDDFNLSQKKNFYLKAFKAKYPDGEIDFFDEKSDFTEFENAVLTPNLFASKRLVITETFWTPENFEKAEKAKIFERLPEMEEQTTVISCEVSLDKRTKSSKFLLKNAKIEHFEHLGENELIDWIIKYTNNEGGKIQMRTAQHLLNRCGENCWRLSQEIKKCLLAQEDKNITEAIINQLTLPHPKVVIWDFLASLSQQRSQTAITKFRELRSLGEAPHMIFAMITREVRIHTQIQAGIEAQLNAKEIASEYGLHPFVVQKTMPLSRNFSQSQLKSMYNHLVSIDTKLKTGGISVTTDDQSEFELAIEKFIVETCQK